MTYISWFSDFALYFEDYLMYKHDTLFFYPFIFIWFFFLVYITSILLLTYDKGHRLRTFYTYSMYIKVWCKKFACRRQWDWPGVYMSPCSLALVLYWNYIQICHYRYWYPNPNHGWLCPPTKCEWGGGLWHKWFQCIPQMTASASQFLYTMFPES